MAKIRQREICAFGELYNLVWNLWPGLEHQRNIQNEVVLRGGGGGCDVVFKAKK